jgi:hypothetical protein
LRRALACLCAALLLPACNGDEKPEPKASPSPTVPVVVATAKPKVVVPKGPAPTTMKTTDLVVGTGALLIPGQVASVHYVAVTYRDGTEFDSTWASGHPFAFRLGNEDVIPGLDQGLLGMRVGGRRMLVIPATLVDISLPPHPPPEPIVMVVDVISTGGAPAQVGQQ